MSGNLFISFSAMLSLLAILSIIVDVTNAKLSQMYDRGPIALSPVAHVSWSVDFAAREISFALRVSDSDLRNTSSDAWVGIGIGEAASGGMLGADIFTAEFEPNIVDQCIVKDRHVPFTSYPLTSGVEPYPVEDNCQTDNSWYLVTCVRDAAKGMLVLEVKRPLDATTHQDRAIEAGEQVLMYAFGGSSFQYHKAKRGSSRVVLYMSDDTLPPETRRLDPLPKDVERNFTIRSDNYTVPNGTTYACKSALLPLPKGEKMYMVAADHVLNSVKGRNMVHHFVVRQCKDTPSTRAFLKTGECPLGSGSDPKEGCSIIFTWAVGVGRFVTPEDVGFVIDERSNMLVMESHFDNPENVTDVVDNSGVRLYLSRARKIEAGILILGDGAVTLGGQTVKSGYNYTSTCPGNCTALWAVPKVNVFASLQHMHTTGKTSWTNRYNGDGTFNEMINSVKFWSNDHQLTRTFNPPKEILRGDILSTTMIFDTTKVPATKFGLETTDEMFIDFVFVYPTPKLKAGDAASWFCGMLYMAEANHTGTLCGDANNLEAALNLGKNPSFNDTVGIQAEFGKAPAQCALAAGNRTRAQKQNAACFPGSASVHSRTRGTIEMAQLRINEHVHVGNGIYSPVFLFTHRVPGARAEFVELETESGEVLRLSAGHHLYASKKKEAYRKNFKLVRADNVRVGDRLLAGDSRKERKKAVVAVVVVTRVEQRVVDKGLYNPQTLHGNIAVNGIVTSTYTAAVTAKVAHALLAPLRAAQVWLRLHWKSLEKD